MILALLTFIVSLVSSLAIIVPLTGIIVRYRVNYNPKGLQLDAEGGAQPHTGPVVSFFGMFQRVYRLEVCLGILSPLILVNSLTGLARIIQGFKWVVGNPPLGFHSRPTSFAVPTLLSTLVIILVMVGTLGIWKAHHGPYRYVRCLDGTLDLESSSPKNLTVHLIPDQ